MMSLSHLSSLLALVDPEGHDAQAAFRSPENAKCRRFGRSRDALTGDEDDAFDLSGQMLDPGAYCVNVHLALSFDSSPKDVSKGFVFGSDRETCDVLLAKENTSGISGNHFSISVDWLTGNPLITCLTPIDGTGIRILSDGLWVLYLRDAWRVVESGIPTTIKISEKMKLVVHNPGRENREPAYSSNLQNYFKRCQEAVPEMTHLKLYDPEPTPLLVSRGRGLNGMEYFTISTSVGEKVVSCEAKSHQNFTGDSQTFIIKRFRNVKARWPDYAKTGLRELRDLRHRHIIALEDLISDTTEWMPVYLPEPPESLADRQISAPLTEIDAGQVLAQTFEGLKFLHENGIVHGGLYPGNIRIKRSDPWSIKLSDIGLHRYVDLENPKERQLYASHVKAGFHKPMPVLDTWSAGVVGLSLLSPGGLPIRPAHPNYAQSSWITALARRATAFHACERPGPSGKKDAALFLTRVLRFAYKDRLTAEECLQDPWIELWRLPVSYDREDSQDPSDAFSSFSGGAGSLGTSSEAGSMHEEAEAEEEEEEEEVEEEEEEEEGQNEEEEAGEGSDQDTETEEPYTSTLRSKQPQTSRHTSVASRSNPQQRRSATPPDLLNPWDTSTVSRHTSVGPSDSGPKQGSVAPPDSANRGERTQASRHSSAQPSSTFPSNRAFQGSIPSSSSHPTGTTPPDSTGSGDVGATQGGLRQIRRRGQGRGEGTIPAWQEGDKHLFGHFQA